jgi:hypothetical protein
MNTWNKKEEEVERITQWCDVEDENEEEPKIFISLCRFSLIFSLSKLMFQHVFEWFLLWVIYSRWISTLIWCQYEEVEMKYKYVSVKELVQFFEKNFQNISTCE